SRSSADSCGDGSAPRRCPAWRRKRPSAFLLELTGEDRAELAGEGVELERVAAQIVGEFVIGENRWNGGDQAQCRRKQRFGNAGRHHRKAGVLGRGDRSEA